MNTKLKEYTPKVSTKEQQLERIEKIKSALAMVDGKRQYESGSITNQLSKVAREQLLENGSFGGKVSCNPIDTAVAVDDLIRDGLGTLSITTLAEIMEDAEGEIDPSVRAKVAQYIVDRILGKPTERKEIKTEINQKSVVINMATIQSDTDLREMGLIFDETIDL